ncbi:MAG: spore maturation protein A [Ruminococcus sp.]|nr:spore maturation protein A [Ruminococcus sp.]
MLSYIFAGMILISLIFAAVTGNMAELSSSALDSASEAITLILKMCGGLCMWSGVMAIAKDAGLTEKMSKIFAPLLRKLFPDIDEGSDAFSYISMNISANLLGLGNAATPLGLSAMKELRKNSIDDRATDSMVTFVVMNTASIQMIPTTVAVLRRSYGSSSPFDVIFCVWISSALALMVGLCVVKVGNRFSIRN